MAVRTLLLIVLVTACGRIGFDGDVAGDGGSGDAVPGDALPGDANLVFVTSRAYPLDGLGGGMADQVCAMHAGEGGFAGTFRAWISTSTSNAVSRLADARGWVRFDGQPVADLPADIAQGKLFVPIRYDERGSLVANTDLVATATRADGMLKGDNCADFTSTTGDVNVGTPVGTASDWTDTTIDACRNTARLYCFQIDHQVPVTPTATSGRLAFVSRATWDRGGGIASADALCGGEASRAGIPGTFLAVLPSTSASAASRFSAAGPTWVRRDGVAIGSTAADVLAGSLLAPPNVTVDHAYYGGPVVTGAQSILDVATATSSCADWSTRVGNGAITGSSGTISSRWFDDARYISPCSGDEVVYCFQQ